MSLYHHVTVADDLMFVNGVCFLLSISLKIKFITTKHICSLQAASLAAVFLSIKKAYLLRGFIVGKIKMYPEFLPLTANRVEHRIILNCCAENEHIPKIK